MKGRLELIVVILLVVADQASKAIAEATLPFEVSVPVLPFLAAYLTYNKGIAFSLLAFMDDTALIALTIAIMVFVAWLWHQADVGRLWARIGFTLVFGGALGNLIDRLVHGHVVDFILFHTPHWSFAVFNLADSFITVGAALIILDEFLILRQGAARRAGDAGDDGNS